VPQPLIQGFESGGAASQANLTNVGVDLGQQILSSVPAQARPAVEPFIAQIVDGIHQAFSISIAGTMWVAVIAAMAAAAVVALLVPELELSRRATTDSERTSLPAIPITE
jgi:hypothetical protein